MITTEPIAQCPVTPRLGDVRGRNENSATLLNADLLVEPPKESREELIRDYLGVRFNNAPADSWRKAVVSWTWRIRCCCTETEHGRALREKAEDETINVFARSLSDLLMAASAGMRATMGLDPGSAYRGEKVAVVDATGKVLAHRHHLSAHRPDCQSSGIRRGALPEIPCGTGGDR